MAFALVRGFQLFAEAVQVPAGMWDRSSCRLVAITSVQELCVGQLHPQKL